MAAYKSYARLGFFVAVALAVVIGTTIFFIHRIRSQPVLAAVTLTTENVSGLDVASLVRFRGVTVGRVSDLRLSQKGSIVEIDFELYIDRIDTLRGDVGRVRELAELGLFSDLRAQVIGNPVTGEAYLLLDMPKDPPPPMALDFKPDRPYVPMMASPVDRMRERLPEVIDRAETTLRTFSDIVARLPASLDKSDRFLSTVERTLRESDLPSLSADSRRFFAQSGVQIGQLSADIQKVMGSTGTMQALVEDARTALKAADLPATAQATRNASNQTILAVDDLRRSLPAIRESLEQLSELAKMLEEQPEVIVYGPRPKDKPE